MSGGAPLLLPMALPDYDDEPLLLPLPELEECSTPSEFALDSLPEAKRLAEDKEFWDLHDEVRPLGRGCFGTVLLVTSRGAPSNAPAIAAKVIDTSSVGPDDPDPLREAAILKELNHPHIVSLVDVLASPTTLFVVTHAELGGDLATRAERAPGGVLQEADARRPVACVLSALKHLHGLRIVHRDVKAANVLLSPDGSNARLADFGLATRVPEEGRLTTVCGTHDFLAPEMILTGHGERDGYGETVDLWALGLMVWTLLYGANPFERDTDIGTLSAILAGAYDFPAPPAAPVAAEPGAQARALLSTLLVTDPERRATAEQAAEHPWLAEGAKPPAGMEPKRRLSWPRLWGRGGAATAAAAC